MMAKVLTLTAISANRHPSLMMGHLGANAKILNTNTPTIRIVDDVMRYPREQEARTKLVMFIISQLLGKAKLYFL